MRTLAVVTLTIATFDALPAADPFAPATVTSAKAPVVLGEAANDIAKQSGVPVAVAPNMLKTPLKDFKGYKATPFWEALQATADASGTRLVPSKGGREMSLVPRGPSRESASVSGPFRVVSQQVTGRALLTEGIVVHDLQLLVHWEPRLRVYRIDTGPKISAIKDVPGTKLTTDGGGSQVLPSDCTSELRVRVTGLTRDSDKLTQLAGTFGVTAAEKMLAFDFVVPGGRLPDAKKVEGVTAALKRVQKKGDTWEVVVEVGYPDGQPTFESFQGEWWLRDNRLLLIGPNAKPVAIDDYESLSPDNPRPLRVIYRFKEDAARGIGNPTAPGWALVYETPAPLREVRVPFELKDIPLP
ncbi:MAG: hypothetical protein FJ304_16410 [Planctomycetes bacterium]|nr:hypothetical protein [Planctomycetota bacterium]